MLQIEGASEADALSALTKTLVTHPQIGRARVRTTSARKTMIDVSLQGLDGIGLALNLGDETLAGLGLELVEASSGRLHLRWR